MLNLRAAGAVHRYLDNGAARHSQAESANQFMRGVSGRRVHCKVISKVRTEVVGI